MKHLKLTYNKIGSRLYPILPVRSGSLFCGIRGDITGATQAIKDMGQAVIRLEPDSTKHNKIRLQTALGNVVDEVRIRKKEVEGCGKDKTTYTTRKQRDFKDRKAIRELTRDKTRSNDETLSLSEENSSSKGVSKD